MDRLNTSYWSAESLDAGKRERMFRLFERYYDAVDVQTFERDLRNKSVVILLTDGEGVVQGFSTVEVILFETPSGAATAVYSGDTIISHHHWGDQQLARAWCYFAGQVKQQRPHLPLYWFLIVKGHRTYRYLPAFSRRYYPTYKEQTPPDVQLIMDQLAAEKFGDSYQPEGGVIHFQSSRGHLREEWADLRAELVRKPNIAFFLERNPGFAAGDELVCITELSESNMRYVSRAAFLEGMNSCQHGLIFDLESRESATG
jgi:hypothetical protein